MIGKDAKSQPAGKRITCSVCGASDQTMYKCSNCGSYFCANCVIRGSSGQAYCPDCSKQCYPVDQQYEDDKPTIFCSNCGEAEETMYQCSNCGSYYCAGCAIIGSDGNRYCPSCSSTCYVITQE